jgi:hypothetical protein
MNELEERARSQLMIIERMYGVNIQSRDVIARTIAEGVADSRQILRVCTYLNSWLAMSGASGDITVPRDVLANAIKRSKAGFAAEGR